MSDSKDWLTIEKLVQIFEKSISPDSSVDHNVRLRDLTNPNRKRQCDIVITSGQKPRQTITIAEVQKRTRKTDPTTFDGWLKKMERVGAQHLICVSTVGFTETIKDEARKRGNTVKLITLTPGTTKLPLSLPSFQFTVPGKIEIKLLDKVEIKLLEKIPNELQFIENLKMINVNENLFYIVSLQSHPVNIFGIIQCYFEMMQKLEATNHLVEFPMGNCKLFMRLNESIPEISLRVSVNFIKKEANTKVEFYSYEQLEVGPIAWMFEGSYMHSDGKRLKIRMPFSQNQNGQFIVSSISTYIE